MKKSRIYGEPVDINQARVASFYDNRAQNIHRMANPHSAALLSDHNPKLVEERMNFDKNFILPKLNINNSSKVLDIGCGIGRWGEEIIPICDYYYGVDFSQRMIDIANERSEHFKTKNFKFDKMSFQELVSELNPDYDRNIQMKFNRVIISGVLVYINDRDMFKCLESLMQFIDAESIIYISEPCNVEQRLTLKDFPSEALQADYNVIYRTKTEYDEIFEMLITAGFSISLSEIYSALGGKPNFKETDRLYTIFNRG